MKSDKKDLGVKVKHKDLILWEKVKENISIGIARTEDELKINKAMLETAEKKIKEFDK